ncbi:GNAT family N-acetyltransferase [Cerasicoccus fimbriatus]|uniref:GNAT family N-acetyltransferase n=1 Tax=Cerasicoccus fimbriatus TaxID=3014554 RepID=UPI0022B4C274|nr:GNAT family N-acetyltransferase [Cerasicoccus sp. TK19100]
MGWLKDIFDTRYPWKHSRVRQRILPLTFRPALNEEDFAFCESLHEKNIPHGVPKGHLPIYQDSLRSGMTLTLIAEHNSTPVATCGVHWCNENVLGFAYGLVHPDYHGKGIGTTMSFARFGLPPINRDPFLITLCALETSLTFYQSLGFKFLCREDAQDHRFCRADINPFTAELVAYSRDLLNEAGAEVQWDAYNIPVAEETKEMILAEE